MSNEKQARFQEYFQINDSVNVALCAVDSSAVPKTEFELDAKIPPLFKLVNDVTLLEQSALRPLRGLGDAAEDLANYLKLQAKKVDLILAHILVQESQQEEQQATYSYGGSGFKIISHEPFAVGQLYQCKLFLERDAAAVFCYAEVIDVETHEASLGAEDEDTTSSTPEYISSFLFSTIREVDQELIIRSSLHAQSRYLKAKQAKNS
jgi:hypothetical protein